MGVGVGSAVAVGVGSALSSGSSSTLGLGVALGAAVGLGVILGLGVGSGVGGEVGSGSILSNIPSTLSRIWARFTLCAQALSERIMATHSRTRLIFFFIVNPLELTFYV